MEKQARIKRAGQDLRQAIQDVADEQQQNIKIAGHNQRVLLTGQGEAKTYQKRAFSRMISLASTLVAEALSEE